MLQAGECRKEQGTAGRHPLWKAQSAADDEKRKKVTKKLISLAKKEGIGEAPEGTANELYGNKWETVAEYDLTGDIPGTLFDGGKDGLLYIIHYRTFKIIRKAKKEKRVLTEREAKEKEAAKKRRQIKAMYKEMHAQMGDFVRSVIDGKTEELKDTAELTRGLWDVLVAKGVWVSNSSMLTAILGKETYEASGEERKAAQEKADALPLHHQMLAVAYHACKDIELADCKGGYAVNNAGTLKKLYACLALYGFSFAGEENTLLMEGSYPLYAVEGLPQEERPEDDVPDGAAFAGQDEAGEPEADFEDADEAV